MSTFRIAIVGRPNVGKSSLFNALCGQRVSIVDSTPGVTRDRVSADIEHAGRTLEIVDTGGRGMGDEEALGEEVNWQIKTAIRRCDAAILVVDARQGIQPLDRRIAQDLREADKPTVVAANKCDNQEQTALAADFYELGLPEVLPISAIHRSGLEQMLDRVTGQLPPAPERGDEEEEPVLKVAIVGRRNVGKSTLINTLAREERVIVSEEPGTTRDAVDVRFRMDDLEFVAIDTAGMRRKKSVKNPVEYYGMTRTIRSIARADAVIHMLAAPNTISRVDKRLAGEIADRFKPCIFAVNKMDLAEGVSCQDFADYVWDHLPWMWFAPVACLIARTGEGVRELIEAADELHLRSRERMQTSELNDAIAEIQADNPPPSDGNGYGKILYATQAERCPPTFVLFTNRHIRLTDDYRRYLANELRTRCGFEGIPLKLVERESDDAPAKQSAESGEESS
jgi:GTP-binding protein